MIVAGEQIRGISRRQVAHLRMAEVGKSGQKIFNMELAKVSLYQDLSLNWELKPCLEYSDLGARGNPIHRNLSLESSGGNAGHQCQPQVV